LQDISSLTASTIFTVAITAPVASFANRFPITCRAVVGKRCRLQTLRLIARNAGVGRRVGVQQSLHIGPEIGFCRADGVDGFGCVGGGLIRDGHSACDGHGRFALFQELGVDHVVRRKHGEDGIVFSIDAVHAELAPGNERVSGVGCSRCVGRRAIRGGGAPCGAGDPSATGEEKQGDNAMHREQPFHDVTPLSSSKA